MGTRSTTKIYDSGDLILSLYKQMDGYPDGWGTDLKEFIEKGKWVNGISLGDKTKPMFNGIGDFALQLVTEFKEGCGGLYATSSDDEQEYNYTISFVYKKDESGETLENCKIVIKCLEDNKFNQIYTIDKDGKAVKIK